jgi:hypothetical protein
MRRVLALVLCLLLPLQGLAATQLPAPPCPMHEMMVLATASGDTAKTLAEAMEACCNDLATFERTGQACKSVPNCVMPAAVVPAFADLVAQSPVSLDPQAPAWRRLPPGATTRHWRPPASV